VSAAFPLIGEAGVQKKSNGGRGGRILQLLNIGRGGGGEKGRKGRLEPDLFWRNPLVKERKRAGGACKGRYHGRSQQERKRGCSEVSLEGNLKPGEQSSPLGSQDA